LSALGLGAVLLAVATFDVTMPYPGAAALLPTLGTAALIAGGTLAPGSWPSRLLASPPAVAIGLVSYSWYLWHWPLLALAREVALGARDLPREVTLGALALGLAWLTYRFIEKPIRERQVWAAWSSRKVLGATAAAMVLLVASAGTIRWWEHRVIHDPSSRFAPFQQAARDFNPRLRTRNHDTSFTKLVALDACTFPPGASGHHVMVWGDADHLMPLLEAAAPGAGLRVSQRTMNGCSPLLGDVATHKGLLSSECNRFNQAVLAEIRERRKRGLVGIVLGGRWSRYGNSPALSVHEQSAKLAKRPGNAHSSPESLEAALKHTLATLTGMGLRVIVMGPVPEQRFNVPWCLGRRDTIACNVTRQEAEIHRADVLAAMSRAVAGMPSTRLLDPFDMLCAAQVCPAERGGAILYFDDDHLSATAARSLAPWFGGAVKWLAGPAGLPTRSGEGDAGEESPMARDWQMRLVSTGEWPIRDSTKVSGSHAPEHSKHNVAVAAREAETAANSGRIPQITRKSACVTLRGCVVRVANRTWPI
jgi:hypothetical protein